MAFSYWSGVIFSAVSIRLSTIFMRFVPALISFFTSPLFVNGEYTNGFCGIPARNAACGRLKSFASTPKTPCSSLYARDVVAGWTASKRNNIQVCFENLLFRKKVFQTESQQNFFCFPVEGDFVGQDLVLDQLLGQRTSSRAVSWPGYFLNDGTYDGFWNNTFVLVKIFIFCWDDSIFYKRRDVFLTIPRRGSDPPEGCPVLICH